MESILLINCVAWLSPIKMLESIDTLLNEIRELQLIHAP